jgi:alpha-L-fucosidase
MLTQADLVDYLVDTVAKNGNVLINVGPDSYGHIPDIQQAPLLGLGDWMSINGEAIYATRPWHRFKNLRGRTLRYTQTDTALYAIVIGAVERSFTIEQPGITSSSIDVLGAKVVSTQNHDGLLTLTLNNPLMSPAAVVRFNVL